MTESWVLLIILLGFPSGSPCPPVFTLIEDRESPLWEEWRPESYFSLYLLCHFALLANICLLLQFLPISIISPLLRISKCIGTKLEMTFFMTNGEAGRSPYHFWTNPDLLMPPHNWTLRDFQQLKLTWKSNGYLKASLLF